MFSGFIPPFLHRSNELCQWIDGLCVVNADGETGEAEMTTLGERRISLEGPDQRLLPFFSRSSKCQVQWTSN